MDDKLMKAIDLFDETLSSPEQWTRGTYCRNSHGHACSGENAVAFCLMGTFDYVSLKMKLWQDNAECYSSLKQYLAEAIAHHIGAKQRSRPPNDTAGFIIKFNDAPTTSFDDIRVVIDLMQARMHALIRMHSKAPISTPPVAVEHERVLEDA